MQYILSGKNSAVKAVFRYDLNGFITGFEVEGITNSKQLKYLFWNNNFPFPYTKDLIKLIIDSGYFFVKIVEDDLSFERFWKLYNYKVSRKKAEKLYAKISKANRIKIFLHLPKYDAYLQHKGIEKAYPDTYLRNEKWNDEY